ncbi:hypothetical protein RJ639_036290 [Escallonia herrerae]|uniref:Glycosylphosphatidylinositol anchor attachment 1 protein n=1 Tax=Escallonia herrerae TaxID=1293975 RepID=A0AA88WQ10_9ASTE|nr:hypothetical protein RJ639_036290 [Escallonia herrerae]
MAESEKPSKAKHRLLIRAGILIITHTGVLALLLLPILAKNTYISENALLPGSARSMLSAHELSDANKFVKEISSLNVEPVSTGIETPRLIAQHIADLGGEVSYHKFHPQLNKFHPLHFFSSPDPGIVQVNYSCSSYGINTVGIIRAPRGDGKEAIVLVTPYNSLNITPGEALSLGLAYSVFSLLTRVSWLAKDVIWLAADSRHGEYAPVAAWLRDYHAPTFDGLGKPNVEICGEISDLYQSKLNLFLGNEIADHFRRAGTIAAGLVIKVADKSVDVSRDTLSIYAEASNGQMPNLDLINTVNYLAVHGQGLLVKVEKFWSFLDSKWLKAFGEIFESVGKVAKSLNPQWVFGVSAMEYIEGAATLASSLYNQALGVPTGPHGAFRDYQVDAITMELSPKLYWNHKAKQAELLQCLDPNAGNYNNILAFLASINSVHFLDMFGKEIKFSGSAESSSKLVEGVLRSINNLLEKFHQSFFLYLLTSPHKFVSVGVYMIAFALLVAPLPVVAASLYSDTNKRSPTSVKHKLSSSLTSVDEAHITFRSWRWLSAAKTVFVVHLWGAVVTLLPYFICQLPNCRPTTSLLVWVSLSVFGLVVLHLVFGCPSAFVSASQPQGKEWALLKSVTVSAAFVGLCLMSVINFATAEIGALLMVPMCLMAIPVRLDTSVHTFRAVARTAFNVVFILVGCPVVHLKVSTTSILVSSGFGLNPSGFGTVPRTSLYVWFTFLVGFYVSTFCYILVDSPHGGPGHVGGRNSAAKGLLILTPGPHLKSEERKNKESGNCCGRVCQDEWTDSNLRLLIKLGQSPSS